jgi:hypothetical protein
MFLKLFSEAPNLKKNSFFVLFERDKGSLFLRDSLFSCNCSKNIRGSVPMER